MAERHSILGVVDETVLSDTVRVVKWLAAKAADNKGETSYDRSHVY